MCEMFHTLPEPGGLMDQPLWFLTMIAISHDGATDRPAAPPVDPLANLPMMLNG